jgi:hypothetical protein
MFCELQRKEGVVPEPAEWMEPMQMIAAALGVEARQLVVGRPEILTDDERAQHLGVAVAQLQTPFELTPAVLQKDDAFLMLWSPQVVAPPSGIEGGVPDTGVAVFARDSDRVPGAVISFPRREQGRAYLVEFHIALRAPGRTFQFRAGSYPPEVIQVISLTGGQALPLVMLIQPSDADNRLIAGVVQENNPEDELPWLLYSVRVSVTQ